jgi:hypothetical protein
VRIEVPVGAHDPLPYPEATVFVLVRGDGARAVAVPAPYAAVLAIDDSTYPLGPARPGRHFGPVEQAGAGFTIELGSLDLLRLALATNADLRVGLATVTLGKRLRRGARALYRAALCGLKSSDRP